MDRLLNEVKNYLDITISDEATDQKVNGMIERGKNYLCGLAGCSLDFNAPAQPKALLLDYCRYARSNALEMFAVNFRSELIGLKIQKEVDAYANSSTRPL